jgi:glucose-6-phosphate isomerase/transaldolase/glucose-6-phosphate isomerase
VEAGEYGEDRVFVHVGTDHASMRDIEEAGHPVFHIEASRAEDLGRIFFLSEFATAVAGWALGINPFDQPNVQEAKDNTQRVLKEGAPEQEDGDLDALLSGLAPPRYLAIMGYVPYTDAADSGAARLRERAIREHHVATTYGYGPRFLHSTGQFHKGGPKVGAFLQIVDEPQDDLEIPGEDYTFGTLIRAQADGDLQTLRSHGLDAVRAGKEIL